ncbi:MAG: carboxypeptidase-like regulatory domain-containing protein [Polaribacter sp.]|uniref:carboxypeptidase-like regulatory domain-containing protein n=1 Tax=Polaribacter sp. TaxID=1920175 RepID=UPI003BAFB10F
MKNNIFLFLLFFSISISSQIDITGTVYFENKPLENVAVYLNNTMLGTTTNEKGEFLISVKEGQYELIVSYLGFKKINYVLNTSTYIKPLVFVLEEDENVLNEVIIKKIVYDDTWKNNLYVFKQEFIGITELSKDCEILNPEVLYFEFNQKENSLTAFARKPLELKHKSLGYSIIYELEGFERGKDFVTFLGYTRYKELKGGKKKQKRWKENRQKAYNGSNLHFFKSVIKNTFKDEGFIVNQFKRVPNPERPSEDEIKNARELIKLSRSSIDFSLEIETPKNAVDSALVIVKKARLPKFNDYLYKSNLKKEDIIGVKNNTFYLSFDNNLSVVYTKEKEEIGYITRNAFSKKRDPLPQTSSLVPFKKNSILDKSGVLVNPLEVFFEGYWSYEKFGDSLPLDYDPKDISE